MQLTKLILKNKAINLLVVIVLFFGNAVHAQSSEAQWLHNINPSQTHIQFWINTSKSVYPLALAAPASLLAAGFIKKDKELQKKGWQLCSALIVNTVITQGLKYGINRNRPYQDYPAYIIPYQYDNDPSFPSGHTSTAFATATSLSLAYKKWYVIVPSFTSGGR